MPPEWLVMFDSIDRSFANRNLGEIENRRLRETNGLDWCLPKKCGKIPRFPPLEP